MPCVLENYMVWVACKLELLFQENVSSLVSLFRCFNPSDSLVNWEQQNVVYSPLVLGKSFFPTFENQTCTNVSMTVSIALVLSGLSRETSRIQYMQSWRLRSPKICSWETQESLLCDFSLSLKTWEPGELMAQIAVQKSVGFRHKESWSKPKGQKSPVSQIKQSGRRIPF